MKITIGKIFLIPIIYFYAFMLVSANNEINVNNKSYYNKQLITSSVNVSKNTKDYINLLVENKLTSDKKLISTYQKVQKAKNKIKGNSSKKYQRILSVLNYFEAKLGLKIHSNNNIIKILPPEVLDLTLNIGEYYLIKGEGKRTILKLNGFSQSSYMDGQLAPTMSIYNEYDQGDFVRILSTFVLPRNVGANVDEDGFRSNIHSISFDYKLDSYTIGKHILLKIRTKSTQQVEIKQINILDDEYSLYTRDEYNKLK